MFVQSLFNWNFYSFNFARSFSLIQKKKSKSR